MTMIKLMIAKIKNEKIDDQNNNTIANDNR